MNESSGQSEQTAPAPDDWLVLEDRVLIAQCEIDTYRASGPGGQHRNKTSSAVRMRHLPSGVVAMAEESRSQHENRARAIRRLRWNIAFQVRRSVNVDDYEPSEVLAGCISKDRKLVVGRKDARWPQAVQEILDCLTACGMQVSTAAKLLGVSTAELVKFLGKEEALWRRVNEMRTAAGLKGLK